MIFLHPMTISPQLRGKISVSLIRHEAFLIFALIIIFISEHYLDSFHQLNEFSTIEQICADCILLACVFFDAHFVLLIVIICHSHFADYRIVLKPQNITRSEFKWLLFPVFDCVSVWIDKPIWANTVMTVSDTWPIPFFKLMLLSLSYLTDSKIDTIISALANSECPPMYFWVGTFHCAASQTALPTSVRVEESRTTHSDVFVLQPRTPSSGLSADQTRFGFWL